MRVSEEEFDPASARATVVPAWRTGADTGTQLTEIIVKAVIFSSLKFFARLHLGFVSAVISAPISMFRGPSIVRECSMDASLLKNLV